MSDAPVLTAAEKADRVLWRQARDDYTHALQLASDAWKGLGCEVDDATLQAASATILIHMKHLRESSHRAASQPSTARTAMTSGSINPGANPQASGAVPACPKCKGRMNDVRGDKRSDKSPDFVCAQENGDCGKPSKDKKKWFPTASWVEKPNPNAANGQPNAMAGKNADPQSYDDPPPGLGDAAEDDLPF